MQASSNTDGLLLKSNWISLPVLLALTFVSLCMGVALGSTSISVADVFQTLLTRLFFQSAPAGLEDTTMDIVWMLRMPRVLLAFLVGGGLSIVGVAMQTLVRNPLAEPYILGISSGASAGASLFYLGFLPPVLSLALTLPLAAFLGALLTMLVVYMIAKKGQHVEVTRLLLAGVAMSALMGAISTFATLASPELEKMKTVMFWLLGSFASARWDTLLLPAIASLSGLMALLFFSRPLDSMLLGEEAALHLGIPVELFKKLLILMATFLTGMLVASAGAIGFVGLIIPHAVRSIVGIRHQRVVLVSFFVGGIFLIWADILSRTLLQPQELPIGIVTAICGVPFFLYLLRNRPYRFG